MDTKKVLEYIRIATYIFLAILILMLKYTEIIKWTCYLNENFGIICPTCGITRATVGIINLNFSLAISKNAYFTLILFPIFLILFVDDVICMIIKKKSFVEIILGQ